VEVVVVEAPVEVVHVSVTPIVADVVMSLEVAEPVESFVEEKEVFLESE
jgi:hypothetical protein